MVPGAQGADEPSQSFAGALGAGMDPKLIMIPAAMSASCAFMLPVATAPNVIMFSTGKFSIETMAREGFALNLLGAGIISFRSAALMMAGMLR